MQRRQVKHVLCRLVGQKRQQKPAEQACRRLRAKLMTLGHLRSHRWQVLAAHADARAPTREMMVGVAVTGPHWHRVGRRAPEIALWAPARSAARFPREQRHFEQDTVACVQSPPRTSSGATFPNRAPWIKPWPSKGAFASASRHGSVDAGALRGRGGVLSLVATVRHPRMRTIAPTGALTSVGVAGMVVMSHQAALLARIVTTAGGMRQGHGDRDAGTRAGLHGRHGPRVSRAVMAAAVHRVRTASTLVGAVVAAPAVPVARPHGHGGRPRSTGTGHADPRPRPAASTVRGRGAARPRVAMHRDHARVPGLAGAVSNVRGPRRAATRRPHLLFGHRPATPGDACGNAAGPARPA